MTTTVLSILVLMIMAGCGHHQPSTHYLKASETRMLFGTIVNIDVCYEPAQKKQVDQAIAKVWYRFNEMQWRMNIYDDRSDIARINHANAQPVEVGADTYQLMVQAVKYYSLTEGTFDITIYPLIELWKQAEKSNRIPTPQEIAAIKKILGPDQIEFLSGNRIRLKDPYTKIDINGIASGYAADEGTRILKENGFFNSLVDAGGELFASGRNCEGTKWRLGISDPRDRSKLIDMIELENMGVSTSGNYEKFYKIQGQHWSHIINPITGFPEMDVVSATMIAPTAIEADALTKPLCILKPTQALGMIEAMGLDRAAIVIEKKGEELIFSKSHLYDRYRVKNP